MTEFNQDKIVSDLVRYEKEEKKLIELYQALLKVDIAKSLDLSDAAKFKEYLEKLRYESTKHLKTMESLINKYQKDGQ